LAPGLLALLVAGGAGIFAVPAQAYRGCKDEASMEASPTTVSGNQKVTAKVHVKDCHGKAVGLLSHGEPVADSQPVPELVALGGSAAHVHFFTAAGPGSCQANFNPTDGDTDANGDVTTSVSFPPTCPGAYTLAADVSGADVDGVISLFADVREVGGFPNTTPDVPTAPLSYAWMLIAAGLTFLTGGLLLFRFSRE
jgi:hypothetical protein